MRLMRACALLFLRIVSRVSLVIAQRSCLAFFFFALRLLSALVGDSPARFLSPRFGSLRDSLREGDLARRRRFAGAALASSALGGGAKPAVFETANGAESAVATRGALGGRT